MKGFSIDLFYIGVIIFSTVSLNPSPQGVEGAAAAVHALSLPAEAYGNDVSAFSVSFSSSY